MRSAKYGWWAPLLLVLGGARAHAEARYTLEPGDTLEAVAHKFGCETDAVMRANRVDTTLLPAGTKVRVPSCRRRAKVAPRTIATEPTNSNPALAAIDGARPPAATRSEPLVDAIAPAVTDPTASIGVPWHGKLQGGQQLPAGEGYVVRRPQRTWGVPHAVAYVQQAIGNVRSEFPALHNVAIGDMSKLGGGKIDDHRSHQSGLDIDIGFYFKTVPDNYPTAFASADANLDLEATWALVAAFANQASAADGVRVMFLDHHVAGRLYNFALARGVDQSTLDAMFEYPHGKRAGVGIIRHEPHHADHVHVRYRCATDDSTCKLQ
jgi:murein endopeptidase